MTTEESSGFGKHSSIRNWLTFLLGSGLGIFLFLCPIDSEDAEFSTVLGVLVSAVESFVLENCPFLLMAIVAVSAIGGLLATVFRPRFVDNNPAVTEMFLVSKLYLITRLAALFVTVCVMLEVGPEAIRSEDVGGTMVGLSYTLIGLAVILSFAMPFLTDCGIMEFFGTIMKPVIRPLFHVPGRASIDLIASWLASSNTSVLLTSGQYYSGYYTRREAASIMTNFSLVSIPFCMVVAETMDISSHFLLMYGSITAIGIVLAIIGVRIPPMSTIEDNYYNGQKNLNEEAPSDTSLIKWSFMGALERASKFTLAGAARIGFNMMVGILMDLIPIVIAWGTIGTLLVNYTSIFSIIATPMEIYMNILGVQEAAAIAPATLVGFIDMFIPALITASQPLPLETRFIIASLSVVQIIYLTEVGSIIVKSNVGLNIPKLFIIFLERTIIALPLIVFVAKYCL